MDVVIVTLLKPSLRYTLKSIYETIPEPHLIFVLEKGVIGELRNKGLERVKTEFVCIVDDDIILNRDWYAKCMRRLLEDPSLVGVAGTTPQMATCGCMILRTKEFMATGGFPKLDSVIGRKLGRQLVTLEDAICTHMAGGISVVLYQFHWLTHGFQTESKIGININPKQSFTQLIRFLKQKHPDLAFVQLIWIAKFPFTLPFIFKLHKNRTKPQ